MRWVITPRITESYKLEAQPLGSFLGCLPTVHRSELRELIEQRNTAISPQILTMKIKFKEELKNYFWSCERGNDIKVIALQ